MTIITYLRNSGVGTTAEIMALAKDKAAFDSLKAMAREEMINNGVEVTEAA